MSQVETKLAVKVILGAGGFGYGKTGGSDCTDDKKEIQSILDLFKSYGVFEVDTARAYSEGTSEQIIAELDYDSQGITLDTKVPKGNLTAEKVHASVAASLVALKNKKVRTMYLHFPDPAVPLEETLKAVNEEYAKGHFEKFGLSNYCAEDVEKIMQITAEKGWVQPTVYQGLYNLLSRLGENALFPLLRKYNISFFAYSPLAGSFLTGNVPKSLEVEPGARFDKTHMVGSIYVNRFHKDSFYDAIDKLNEVGKPHGLGVQEISLRWIIHHSLLSSRFGDAIITGGRKLSNIQTSLEYCAKGPLPQDVVQAVEEVWANVKADAPPYHY